MKQLKILLTSMLLMGSSYAATFNVSTTAEFRQALLDAAQNGQDDTIVLADGTYKTTDDGGGTFKFLDNEDYELFITGANKENVILDGDKQEQIFNHVATSWNSRITLDSITFKNGLSALGGAVYIDKKGTILNCIFSDNTATSRGGGFYLADRVIVKNSTFTRNQANSDGGGFYSVGTADISDCNFTNNTANQYGGGFRTGRNDTAYVSGSIFKNNSAGVNGGGFSSYWTVIIKDSIFKNNAANGAGVQGYGYGGGFISSNGNAEIENSIFIDNNATVEGGAFSIKRYKLKVTNSLLVNNTTGIYIEEDNSHVIINTVFNNNGSEISGTGGVVVDLNNNYIDESKVNVSMLNNGNIYDGVNLGFVDETNDDFHLDSSSGLIDAGIDSYTGVTIPITDLDGNPRPVGASTDIGPYEYNPTEPNVPTNIKATDGTFESVVGVTWSEVANTDYYNIYRSESQSETGDLIGITTSASFADDTITEDTRYYYSVQACNDVGCSDNSVSDGGYIGRIATDALPAIITYLLF